MNSTLKKILFSPFRLISAVLDRIVALAGALVFAQYPAFFDQYIQRLGGHVDELAKITRQYSSAAAEHGKTLTEYIAVHLKSGAQEFVSTGKIMQHNLERYSSLQNSLEELKQADPFTSLFVFIKELNMDIFRAAYENFTPGIPLSGTAVLYALTGLITAMLLFWVLKKALQSLYIKSSGRGRKKPAGASHSSINDYSIFPGDQI